MQEDRTRLSRFDNYSAEPRSEVWDRIESELDKKPKRRFIIWWLGTAASILLVVGAVFRLNLAQNYTGPLVNLNHHKSVLIQAKKVMLSDFSMHVQQNAIYSNLIISNVDNSSQPRKANSNNQMLNAKPYNTKAQNSQFINQDRYRFCIAQEVTADDQEFLTLTNESNLIEQHDSLNSAEIHRDSILKSSCSDFPIFQDNSKNCRKSKWALNINAGNYRTGTDQVPSNAFNSALANFNSGLDNSPIIETLQSEGSEYRYVVQAFGIDGSYLLAPKWQIRTGINLLMYKTVFIDEHAHFKGANYLQWTLGVDYAVLQFRRFNWLVGTAVGNGWLGVPLEGGVQDAFRAEWILSTSFGFKLSQRLAVRLEPCSRLVFADSQVGSIGKLSRWYHGGNLGLTILF